VRDYLTDAGYRVSTARSGDEALHQTRSIRPDLIVLDLGLPGLDGLDVTRTIRRTSTVPIIILTARADEADRIVGLELGADDYLVKPFSPRELLARVRAVLRRSGGTAEDDERPMSVGELTVDPARRRVTIGDRVVDLTVTEFDLLARMAAAPGRVFTRGQLLETIHGVAFDAGERAIDAHVKNIRRKIERDPHRPRILLTVHGVGYRLAEP
jgi:two-component system alkaline phosphatase synthesis response regulator PhoP